MRYKNDSPKCNSSDSTCTLPNLQQDSESANSVSFLSGTYARETFEETFSLDDRNIKISKFDYQEHGSNENIMKIIQQQILEYFENNSCIPKYPRIFTNHKAKNISNLEKVYFKTNFERYNKIKESGSEADSESSDNEKSSTVNTNSKKHYMYFTFQRKSPRKLSTKDSLLENSVITSTDSNPDNHDSISKNKFYVKQRYYNDLARSIDRINCQGKLNSQSKFFDVNQTDFENLKNLFLNAKIWFQKIGKNF